jgi:hypothetical protein
MTGAPLEEAVLCGHFALAAVLIEHDAALDGEGVVQRRRC